MRFATGCASFFILQPDVCSQKTNMYI